MKSVGSKTISITLALVLAGLAHHAVAQEAAEHNAVGYESYKAGNWTEAIASFELALRQAPENDTIRRNLANAYQAEANAFATSSAFRAAIESTLNALQVDPGNAQSLVQLGSYYLREGLVNEAIFRLEEAIELEPENVDAHFLLGESYYKDNDATSALDQWEWVKQVNPGRKGLSERMDTAYRQEKVEIDFEGLSSRNFRLTYTRAVRWGNARSVLNMLEMAYRDIGRQLGGAFPPAPIQVTLYSAEGFSETTQMGEHVGALYDGSKIRVPVLDQSGKPIGMEELRRRLYHEYVHVVARFLAKDHVPWWFNEGLAEAMSRNIEGHDFEFLRRAKSAGILFALSELGEGQLTKLDVESLKLAYRQSHATVTLLINRFGLRRMGEILEAIGDGMEPETVLKQSCRYSYATLERAVAAFIATG